MGTLFLYQLNVADAVMTSLFFHCVFSDSYQDAKLKPGFYMQVAGFSIRLLPRLFALFTHVRLWCKIEGRSRCNNLFSHQDRQVLPAVRKCYDDFFNDREEMNMRCSEENEEAYD